MADITIGAGSTRLGELVASRSSDESGGSAAERTYRRAVRQLQEAQRKLAADLGERAPEETIKLDQQAVELARAAVQVAAAALAREQRGERGEHGVNRTDVAAQQHVAGRDRLDVVV